MISGVPVHSPGQMECPSGHGNPAGMKFCGQCGAPMHGQVPAAAIAWMALALPFVAALSGGKLHGILTVFPAVQWVTSVFSWIGG